ncbi:hypothetical protein K474DRAFT_1678957 [Panus rudis PR-1116 ss-1]|nr:hypothetical protein K474DRAFT_1678957 [Panus rudis PR-1116 ss-1]
MDHNTKHATQGRLTRTDLLAKISALEKEKEALRIRASLLNSKLMTTWDAMDLLKQTCMDEVASERKEKEQLAARLEAALATARTLEREREDLQDVVSELSEKGRHFVLDVGGRVDIICAGSVVHLPVAADPSPIRDPEHQSGQAAGELAYARMALSFLQSELEQERQNHARDKEYAEMELLQLQAKLARREAELEACIYHTGHAMLPLPELRQSEGSRSAVTPSPRNRAGRTREPSPRAIPASSISRTDAERIFGLANVKNRTLEREVKSLNDTLNALRFDDNHGPVRPPSRRGAGPFPCALLVPDQASSAESRTFRSPQPQSQHSRPEADTIPVGPNNTEEQCDTKTDMISVRRMENELRRLADVVNRFIQECREMRGRVQQAALNRTNDIIVAGAFTVDDLLGTDEELTARQGYPLGEQGHPQGLPQIPQQPQHPNKSPLPILSPSSHPAKQASAASPADTPSKSTMEDIIDLLDDNLNLPGPILNLDRSSSTDGEKEGSDGDVLGDAEMGEESMELETPLQATVILDTTTIPMTQSVQSALANHGDHVDERDDIDINPAMIPLPRSPPPPPNGPCQSETEPMHTLMETSDTPQTALASPNAPNPTRDVPQCEPEQGVSSPRMQKRQGEWAEEAERRIEDLEHELQEAKEEIFRRDDALLELRVLVDSFHQQIRGTSRLPVDDTGE